MLSSLIMKADILGYILITCALAYEVCLSVVSFLGKGYHSLIKRNGWTNPY